MTTLTDEQVTKIHLLLFEVQLFVLMHGMTNKDLRPYIRDLLIKIAEVSEMLKGEQHGI